MRYPDASPAPPGHVIFGGDLSGPVAVPGRYQVRLTAGGAPLSESLEIRKDPRLSTTDQDFQKQFELLSNLRDRLTTAHDAARDILRIQGEIKIVMERAAAIGATQDVATAAGILDERLGSIKVEEILAIPAEEAIQASAKMGMGIDEILEAIVKRIPPPQSPPDETLRALIFDSVFDVYRGVIGYVRVVSGTMEANHAIMLMRNNARYEIKEVGVFTPKMRVQERLNPGDVGYFIANIKSTAEMKIGDTITDQRHSAREPLPGFQEIHPMVFSGIYPIGTGDFEHLKTAIGKLRLNDSAFVYQPESSVALGFGFRCGFLGLLHMEIIQERLRREYNMDIIAT